MKSLRHMIPPGGNRGFTLLEILTATIIAITLLSSLYIVFSGTLNLREKNRAALERGTPRAWVLEIMERDLKNMMPPTGILAGAITGESNETESLRKDSLEFFTSTGVVNDEENWPDVQKVGYYLAEPEDPEDKTGQTTAGLDLIRALERNLLASVVEEPAETRLLTGVSFLEITYYDGTVWQDSWDSTVQENTPPQAIRIKMGFENTDADAMDNSPLEMMIEIASRGRSQNQ